MREVRIRDTLSGQPAPLVPREPPKVGIYACGPTVYSRIHVGNARPYVIPTLLARFLAHEGYEPTVVINLTDVNDKIYDAAREAGVPSAEHAAAMIAAYREDTDRLGIGRPDAEPLATETIPEIIELIEALIEGGHAYQANGDVYFRVRSFDGYGKLSNREPEQMDQGEEAGAAQLKESPLDFALWKARKPDEDTFWDSPWGDGRPGWHIECSAMAEKLLGADFEIHSGGSDLVFPHHENEIAQTEAARGLPLARIWMHNGMVQTDAEKMSKSLGNIFQLSEAIDRFGPHAVVAYLISGHYRQPLAFGEEALEAAAAGNERIRDFFRGVDRVDGGAAPRVEDAREAFLAALADDFNTQRAMAEVFDLITEGHREPLAGAHAVLEELLEIVGLESLAQVAEDVPAEAAELLEERERARAERDFARADEIRDRLAELGWTVRDTPTGAKLVRSV
ncbi:MAG: cysteinyl-tRNA synthetase [Solirubrobacterales bacterium]|jgi:cysteinyl-tRNA synthetase|nr:cysteinyl-tRNA synthetase [Solirubrobacterales bacterium]